MHKLWWIDLLHSRILLKKIAGLLKERISSGLTDLARTQNYCVAYYEAIVFVGMNG